MTYKYTPVNILSLFLFGVAMYAILNSKDPGEIMGAGYIFMAIIVGMLIDFTLQVFIKKYKTIVIVEMVLIILLVIINSMP